MITTRLYLDARAVVGTECEAPIKLQITKRGRTALLSTGVRVLPSQWDKASLRVVRHPSKASINTFITKFQLRVDDLIRDMVLSGAAADLTSTEIKNAVQDVLVGSAARVDVESYFLDFASCKSASTQQIYRNNFKVLLRFDPGVGGRSLSAVTPEWAQRFSDWMSGNYSANTRRQVLSNCNAVFRHALEDHVVSRNPFHGIRLAYVVTRKRNLSAEQLRRFWSAPCETDRERISLDLFRFSFLAIAINSVDIAGLGPGSIFNGRLEYDRAKTGKHYSVRIEPELQELLDTYSGPRSLFTPFERFSNYQNLVTSADQVLARMAVRLGLPAVTLYWARHTWASLAAELDIPVDVISSALGHSHGARVTMVYINSDLRKVDDANRRVIDFALYGRK